MILIFSPQNWSHQFISKHHYAIAFSKKEKTYFFEPTTCEVGNYQVNSFKPFAENDNLTVVKITLPFPDIIRFQASSFFKFINKLAIGRWLKKSEIHPKLLIDFGCHKSISDWSFIPCKKRVYFPVDDYHDLPIENRKCNFFFTVSSVIQEKFRKRGIPMNFINHGLNEIFAIKARKRLEDINKDIYPLVHSPLKIGYSGNLAIPYLDRELVLKLVKSNSNIEFHFFGSCISNDSIFKKWLDSLTVFSNVFLHGQVTIEELSGYLFSMDIMLLCYQPDNQNYHAENSHKINEYLSTGRPLLTTFISILKNSNFTYPISRENIALTEKSILDAIDELNSINSFKIKERISYALQFRYEEQAENILYLKNWM